MDSVHICLPSHQLQMYIRRHHQRNQGGSQVVFSRLQLLLEYRGDPVAYHNERARGRSLGCQHVLQWATWSQSQALRGQPVYGLHNLQQHLVFTVTHGRAPYSPEPTRRTQHHLVATLQPQWAESGRLLFKDDRQRHYCQKRNMYWNVKSDSMSLPAAQRSCVDKHTLDSPASNHAQFVWRETSHYSHWNPVF